MPVPSVRGGRFDVTVSSHVDNASLAELQRDASTTSTAKGSSRRESKISCSSFKFFILMQATDHKQNPGSSITTIGRVPLHREEAFPR